MSLSTDFSVGTDAMPASTQESEPARRQEAEPLPLPLPLEPTSDRMFASAGAQSAASDGAPEART